jgi:hypothetical protein
MPLWITPGMTPSQVAQILLGNGSLWQELFIPGWDGNPYHMPSNVYAYGPSEAHGKPAGPPAAPDPFNTDQWKNIPQEYRNMLEDLSHQWEQLTGFRIPISHQAMLDMAQANVMTLSDFGAYMWGKMDANQQTGMPWAQYGLNADQFKGAVADYNSTYKELTGQSATPEILAQALKNQYTGAEWRSYLMQDQNMLKTYGWLKFGLSYTQFQQNKTTMQLGLGKMPTDDQALKQLQYSQAARDSFAVTAPPPQKKSTPTDFAGSVAR